MSFEILVGSTETFQKYGSEYIHPIAKRSISSGSFLPRLRRQTVTKHVKHMAMVNMAPTTIIPMSKPSALGRGDLKVLYPAEIFTKEEHYSAICKLSFDDQRAPTYVHQLDIHVYSTYSTLYDPTVYIVHKVDLHNLQNRS